MQWDARLPCTAAAATLRYALPLLPHLQTLAQPTHAENAGTAPVAAAQPQPEPPRSVRRTHTPSRTGLTARAVRPPPSRLGLTPGTKPAAEQFEVPASARAAAAAPATGKNLKSILKRLNFSATKAKAAATVAAATGGGDAPHTLARPAQPAAATAESTIKQLRFDVGATPAAATAAKPTGRHVSFDAATVSPAARGARALGSAGPSSALPARTPEPAIAEEGSEDGGSQDSGSAGGASTVNSAAAGHTPYDRRLSSLFRKYQVGGLTPELPDAELEELLGPPGGRWERGGCCALGGWVLAWLVRMRELQVVGSPELSCRGSTCAYPPPPAACRRR